MRSGFTGNGEEEILFDGKTRGQSMGFIDLTLFFVCMAIGTGITKLGPAFNAGWVVATISNTLFALITGFSNYLMFLAFIKTKNGGFEGCTLSLMNYKVGVVFSIFGVIPFLSCVFFYFRFCQTTIKSLIEYFVPTVNFMIAHEITISLILFTLIFVPLSMIMKVGKFVHISRMKFVLLLIMGVMVTLIFYNKYKTIGFDPNNELKAVNIDKTTLLNCLNAFTTAYLMQPISFPSISNLNRATGRRIKWITFTSIFVIWIFYSVFGFLEYFTLFNSNPGGVFFSLFPNNNSVIILSKCVMSLSMIVSIVIVTNPIRNVIMLTIVPSKKGRSKSIWVWISYIIFIAITFLTQSGEFVTNIITFICDVTGPLAVATQPSILYLLACWKDNRFFDILAMLLSLLGIVLAIIFIYIDAKALF